MYTLVDIIFFSLSALTVYVIIKVSPIDINLNLLEILAEEYSKYVVKTFLFVK